MTSFENLHDDAICEIIEKLDDYNDVMNLLSTRLYFIKDKDFFIKCWINSRKPFTLRQNDTNIHLLEAEIEKYIINIH